MQKRDERDLFLYIEVFNLSNDVFRSTLIFPQKFLKIISKKKDFIFHHILKIKIGKQISLNKLEKNEYLIGCFI